MNVRLLFTGLLGLAMVLVLVLSSGGVSGAPAERPLAPVAPSALQASVGPEFTYQGRLTDGDGPASGHHDFRIFLYDVDAGGSQVGSTVLIDEVPVEDGLFSLPLNFGPVIDGRALWIEIGVRASETGGAYTTLSPRQPLTAAPYALYAMRSGGAWGLSGNTATSPNANFIGTTDGQPLVVKTNGIEALRVEVNGNVGIGVKPANARLDVQSPSGVSGLLVTSDTRPIIGRLGSISCPGSYAVGGCAGNSPNGIGVLGDSNSRGVVGTLGSTSCAGSYAVGGCAGNAVAVGVYGRSATIAAMWASTDTGDLFVGVVGDSEIRRARINANGRGYFNDGTQTGGADYAESMRATDDAATLEPGDVLELDPDQGYAVRQSRGAGSLLVAGVYSTRPSILAVGDHGIDDPLTGEVPVALLGVVPTKVSAENGPIEIGDLLTTATLPGHAMKARPQVVGGVSIYPTGAILGKALEPLLHGTGTIKVLVTLR